MPMVEYFDQGTQSRKKKEFGYGAMGEENARKFLKLQQGNAARGNLPPPKITKNKKKNKMEGENFPAKKTNKGMGSKLTPKQKLEQQQDYDQKELDKNKPSEAKTPKKEKVYVKDDDEPDKKITVGYGGPDYNAMWS